MLYAVLQALETLRMCGSCHAGHVRRGRPSIHFLHVYAPAEPITKIIQVVAQKQKIRALKMTTIVIIIVITSILITVTENF